MMMLLGLKTLENGFAAINILNEGLKILKSGQGLPVEPVDTGNISSLEQENSGLKAGVSSQTAVSLLYYIIMNFQQIKLKEKDKFLLETLHIDKDNPSENDIPYLILLYNKVSEEEPEDIVIIWSDKKGDDSNFFILDKLFLDCECWRKDHIGVLSFAITALDFFNIFTLPISNNIVIDKNNHYWFNNIDLFEYYDIIKRKLMNFQLEDLINQLPDGNKLLLHYKKF